MADTATTQVADPTGLCGSPVRERYLPECPPGQRYVRYGTPEGRWVLVAVVMASAMVFLDGTVVNVALPAIDEDLDAGVSGLQWIIDGYLLTLGAFLLLGGSLGDRLGRRRVFSAGLVAFAAASALCTIAPSSGALIVFRAVQGIGGALLVPGSLALISTAFHPDDRGPAVGVWTGFAGVGPALGPFVGGWLVDSVSWRLVFVINVPLAALALWLTARHVPEGRPSGEEEPLDVGGAVLVALALGGVVFALIEGPSQGWTEPLVVGAAAVGVLAIVGFIRLELVHDQPMIPLALFANRQFSGVNLTTVFIYGALGGVLFLVVIELQSALGYSAMESGAAFLPLTVIMLMLAPRSGRLYERIGPRVPMTVGPLLAGIGLLLMTRIEPGSGYFAAVLPGAIVFSLGMTLTVPSLTAAALGAVDDEHAGLASGVNNTVARVGQLLAVALLPFAAGIASAHGLSGADLTDGVHKAMWIGAGLMLAASAVSWVTVRNSRA